MAYADYKFIQNHSAMSCQKPIFPTGRKASDFVDLMTSDRLVDGLPTNERSQKRIKRQSVH